MSGYTVAAAWACYWPGPAPMRLPPGSSAVWLSLRREGWQPEFCADVTVACPPPGKQAVLRRMPQVGRGTAERLEPALRAVQRQVWANVLAAEALLAGRQMHVTSFSATAGRDPARGWTVEVHVRHRWTPVTGAGILVRADGHVGFTPLTYRDAEPMSRESVEPVVERARDLIHLATLALPAIGSEVR